MRRRILMGWAAGVWWLLWICTAWADTPSSPGLVSVGVKEPAREAPLNNPPETLTLVKRVINTLDPSYETLWSWQDGTWSQGVSASLYAIQSNDIHLASVRLGYGTGEKLYGGIGLDLPGLARRFVPATIKGYATTQPLNLVWSAVGKYARVTPIAGYNFQERKALYGVTLGAAINF